MDILLLLQYFLLPFWDSREVHYFCWFHFTNYFLSATLLVSWSSPHPGLFVLSSSCWIRSDSLIFMKKAVKCTCGNCILIELTIEWFLYDYQGRASRSWQCKGSFSAMPVSKKIFIISCPGNVSMDASILGSWSQDCGLYSPTGCRQHSCPRRCRSLLPFLPL